jgi:hypothetical protein
MDEIVDEVVDEVEKFIRSDTSCVTLLDESSPLNSTLTLVCADRPAASCVI